MRLEDVFLDLTFLINERVDISLNLIEQLYGPSGRIEISVLTDKSFISFNDHGYIVMHDLVKGMGLKIARQRLRSDPKNPTRLWRLEDIDYFFSCGKEIEAIRCMSLDMSKIKSITLTASSFQKFHNLIFLKIYKSDWRKPSMLNIDGVLHYFPEELRFLSWEEFPLSYVPLHFCAENLVTLEMPNSNIQELWMNQHFPNLEEIDLSYSKHLIALPDLSRVPKIKYVRLVGCVSLAQVHASTTLGNRGVTISLRESGPKQLKFGGSMKGKSSGLVIVYTYLDLHKLSFHKVRMKVYVCGKTITGMQYKNVVMSLEEKAELRKGIQSLGFLLPFVERVEWLGSPIEFGDDFNQHYTCDWHFNGHDIGIPLLGYDREEMSNDHEVVKTLMKVKEEEADDELIMEYCGDNTNTNIFTRPPKSITRWSLLKKLILNNGGRSIVEDSMLKSLSTLSHDDNYWRRIKPLLDVKVSFRDIPPPDGLYGRYSFNTFFNLEDANQQRQPTFSRPLQFGYCLSRDSPWSSYNSLMLDTCADLWSRTGLRAWIKEKRV